MNLDLGKVLGGVLLIAAAAGSMYLARPPPSPAPRTAPPESEPAGFFVRGARMIGTDEEGRITYRISAAEAEEIPDREGLVLRGVRVEYQPDQQVPWLLTAASAAAVRDGGYLDLEGGVRLESLPEDADDRIVIATERLRLEPERFVARSDAPVRIEMPGGHVTGIGLEANLKDDRLRLESGVHGQILP